MPGDPAPGLEVLAGSATEHTVGSTSSRLLLTASTDAPDTSTWTPMSLVDQESAVDDDDKETLCDKLRGLNHKLPMPLPDLTSQIRIIRVAPRDRSRQVAGRGFWTIFIDNKPFVAVQCLHAQIETGEPRETLVQQVRAIQTIRHRNVMSPYAVVYEEMTFFVSPCMKNGNIMKYLSENQDADWMRLMLDVARGLAHLHAQTIVHGALRPSNVLVDDEHSAIVADVWLTSAIEAIEKSPNIEFQSQQASLRYTAPEYFFGDGKYGKPSDVYAWAMTALHVVSGSPPFPEMTPSGALIAAEKGYRPNREDHATEGFTEEAWKLLEDSWEQNPAKRLEMREVVQRIEAMRPDLANKYIMVPAPDLYANLSAAPLEIRDSYESSMCT